MPTTYANLQQAAHYLTAVNHAGNIGLTNATIAPLTTVTGLKDAITALGTTNAKAREAARINVTLEYAETAGILTNTNVASANTLAGLRAIATAIDSSLSAYHSAAHLGD